MNPEEYERLARIDRTHWYYHGKRIIVRWWLDRHLQLNRHDLFLDSGCGTGTLLSEMRGRCRIIGLDASFNSLRIVRPKVPAGEGTLILGGLDRIPLAAATVTAAAALDVIEHLDDDREAVAELVRVLIPGGVLIVTVPVGRYLWSDWDVSLHHRRRYRRRRLLQLFSDLPVEVVTCRYFNTFALPAILVLRLWRRLVPHTGKGMRAEDRIPPPLLNRLLRAAMVLPACSPWFPNLFGVSLLAVVRRR